MAVKRDYYEVLGVERAAAISEIKTAYRRRAKELHPDVNKAPDAETQFKELNEAYSILSDEEKRRVYDQVGHAAFTQGGGGSGGEGFGFNAGGGFGDIFDLFFGAGRDMRNPPGPERGADLRVDVEVSLEEAAQGVEREIQVHRMESCTGCEGTGAQPGTVAEVCPTCRGLGQVRSTQTTLLGSFRTITTCYKCQGSGQLVKNPCTKCNGAGRERKHSRVTVHVPAGSDNGLRVRHSGQGEAGPFGGTAGDLYVYVHVKEHPIFQRRGRDLVCEVQVSFARAALGGSVEVPTLEGKEKFTIRAGTQPGDVFRLPGRGMPDLHRNQIRGDLMVIVKVTTPTNLNDRQRKALEEFAAANGEDLGQGGGDKHHEGGGLFDWVRNIFSGKQDEE